MTRAIFIGPKGERYEVKAPNGTSLMQVARDNGIPGIDGDCGGMCSCATCHLIVDESWNERTGVRSETEAEMLEYHPELCATSRLGCQIKLSDELDGVVVHLPTQQY